MTARRIFVMTFGSGLLATTLCGCGRYYWSKASSTAEQFDRDSRECVQEAKSTLPGPASGRAADVIGERYRTCLSKRGYVRERQSGPPAAGSHRGIESEEELSEVVVAECSEYAFASCERVQHSTECSIRKNIEAFLQKTLLLQAN